jgi:acyl-coenzyme A synthetase/AMP-(fatty) acid ligase
MTLSSCTPYDASPNPVDYIQPWLHADHPVLMTYAREDGALNIEGPFTGAQVLAAATAVQSQLQLTPDDRVMITSPAASLTAIACIVATIQVQAKIITVGREYNLSEVCTAAEKQRPSVLVCTRAQAQEMGSLDSLAGITKGLITDSESDAQALGITLKGGRV